MSGLENKIIISTRPLSQDDSIKKQLIEKGAVVLDFPMIKICPVDLTEKIKVISEKITSCQWLVFTSKNGVEYFFKLLNSLNIHVNDLASTKIAVVGQKTSEEVLKNNFKPCLISSGNTSDDLLKELIGKIEPTEKILLILGDLAGDILENGLNKLCTVIRINVYKTIGQDVVSTDILERIKTDKYNIILFTSPSGFEQFNRIMDENMIRGDLRTACIGQTTEKTMVRNNCMPLFVSPKSEGYHFVKELEHFFNNYKI